MAERAEMAAVIRSIVGDAHDPEFLLAAGEHLVKQGMLGPRATLLPLEDPNAPPVFVALDVGGNPTGCARCSEPYAYSDGWGLITLTRKGGRVSVVLCTACHAGLNVSAKGGAK